MWAFFLAVLALGGTVWAFIAMRKARSELHAMIGAETLPVPQLEMLRQASDQVGGRGFFRKVCEVVGTAHPRPEGLIVSEFSQSECVWYRCVVIRHYEHTEYRDGRRRTSRRTQTVSSRNSSAGYAIRDDQGYLIGLDPAGTGVEGAEMAVNRFEPRGSRGLFGIDVGRLAGGNSTIGYQYREWIVRPGRRMYILGEVHDKVGPLIMAHPEQDGHFIVSTFSEQELRNRRAQKHNLTRIGVIVGAVGTVVLIVVGFLVGL